MWTSAALVMYKDTVWYLDDVTHTRPGLVKLSQVADPELITMHQLHL